MKKLTFGYALTGSFCTFERSLTQMEYILSEGIDILPVMSFNAAGLDTRFGKAKDFIETIEAMTGKRVIRTLEEAEPIGPKKMTDLMIVLPCTGNTLAKLASGIYDTPVTLAVKSHLRNQKPVLIGVSTNDALSSSAKNIGTLMNYRNYYFIPMRQDDVINKPYSIVCDFERVLEAALYALDGKQIEPMIF
ncbi:MAG: dipicolinate synthase subunit B [Ruminococcaceae bacterium]|nr:dipicolinate synthase subunit B [Oscillospiraceae bacterium]MBQ9913148.1 dipicolinate synthase subunit B [Clostridia bacterium]